MKIIKESEKRRMRYEQNDSNEDYLRIFGEKVCDTLEEIYPDTFKVSKLYTDSIGTHLEVISGDGVRASVDLPRRGSGLLKYVDDSVYYLRSQLEDHYVGRSYPSKSWR